MFVRCSILILLLGLTCGKCEKANWSSGVRLLMKLYDGCQRRDILSCVKIKAINFFDRIGRSGEIVLDDNLSIVRKEKVPAEDKDVWENEVETNLARGQVDDSRLDEILLRKVSDFFNSHKIVFNLPKIRPEDLKEEVEEVLILSYSTNKNKIMVSMKRTVMFGRAIKDKDSFRRT
ncbi:hypothetical protein RUM43_013216 [Polyplax serrata]|uniref:Uncharacterized protein n=1 Tax=Polyplax serrata TaxID=468196 RepID=A0AAN8P6F0_POLSC